MENTPDIAAEQKSYSCSNGSDFSAADNYINLQDNYSYCSNGAKMQSKIIGFYGKHHSEWVKRKLSLANKNKHYSPNTEFKKGHIPANKGKKHSEETRKKISESHKGKIRSLESRLKQSQSVSGVKHPLYGTHHTEEAKQKNREKHLGKKHSDIAKRKLSLSHKGIIAGAKHYLYGKHHTEKTKRKMSFTHSGEKNYNWIDGRSFLPYCHKFNKHLKESIRKRDNYTCQFCGIKENGHKHHVHHIHYDKSNCYPDLITLCHSCNTKVNYNRPYYDSLFMNKLNDRQLLLWTRDVIKE